MANIAAKRIKRELRGVVNSEEVLSGEIKLELVDENWLDLRGEILGPRDTPYEGGHFELEIKIPNEYPFAPPNIRFTNFIWHPNVSSVTGHICLDILKNEWAAALTLRTVLLSIQALLSSAEPDDPQDAVVATQFKENYEMFVATARHWTNKYAKGPYENQIFDAKVKLITDLGTMPHVARVSLSNVNWRFDDAVDNLFNS